MPHRARLTLPNMPMDIIQRGNCRQACFSLMMTVIFIRRGCRTTPINPIVRPTPVC